MTVIAGLVDKKTGKIYIGADRGYFDDDNHYVSPEPKIIKKRIGKWNGKPIFMIIGGAGDIKPGNIITHWYTPKLKRDPSKHTPHEFMIKIFAPALKELFEKNGYKKSESEFLIAFEGEIFLIDGNYAVTIPPQYGICIGSAHVPAQGALHAMNNIKAKIAPKKKIELALKASIGISNTAKGPIDILSV